MNYTLLFMELNKNRNIYQNVINCQEAFCYRISKILSTCVDCLLSKCIKNTNVNKSIF